MENNKPNKAPRRGRKKLVTGENENLSQTPTVGRKRKQVESVEDAPVTKRNRKKKLADVTEDSGDTALANTAGQDEGTSQVSKKTKTRSSVLNYGSAETNFEVNADEQPLKALKKRKKAAKANSTILGESLQEQTSLTNLLAFAGNVEGAKEQKVSAVKKYKKRVRIEELLHSEIKLEDDLKNQHVYESHTDESGTEVNAIVNNVNERLEQNNGVILNSDEALVRENYSVSQPPNEGMANIETVVNNVTKTRRVKRKSKIVDNGFADANGSIIAMNSELTFAYEDLKTPVQKETGLKHQVNIIDIKSEDNGNNNVVHISINDVDIDDNLEANHLLKQLERTDKPKSPKKKREIDWPQSDLIELLTRMEVCIPQNDNVSFSKRLDKLEWDTISFKNYSVEQCKNTWQKLTKKVRKVRILREILQDAKTVVTNTYGKRRVRKNPGKPPLHPDMPRKPLTAYFIYYMEHRNSYQKDHEGIDAAEVSKVLGRQFTSLPPEIKKAYEEIAAKNRLEYARKMEEFYANHPEVPRAAPRQRAERPPKPHKAVRVPKPPKPKVVKEKPSPKPPKEKIPSRPHLPFHYFYVNEMDKETVEDRAKFKEICKERWKGLPERNKLVWITYAEAEIARYEEEVAEYSKKHPEYVRNPLKPVLSKEDLHIKDRAAGKPTKPPASAYNLFARQLLHTDDVKKVPQKDRLIFVSEQWKYCSEEEKNQYKKKHGEAVQKYKQEFAVYLETLSEEERNKELAKNLPKKVKPEKSTKEGGPSKKPVKKASSKVPKPAAEQPPVEPQPSHSERLKEPEQPPISPQKYFATIYAGTEPVQQAWKALAKDERRFYSEELEKKKRAYIQEFERFLKSLSEEELAAFSLSRKKIKQEQAESESKEPSDEDSDSDDSDEADSSSDEDDN